MRAAALLVGLCLAWPAFGAPKGESACTAMLMPPEQLHEISRGFGHGHTGIDLMAPYGSPIRAAAGGTVVYAGWYFAYGNIVDIRHADGLITRYGHMSSSRRASRRERRWRPEAMIGRVGTTGRAHGPHVHFEVRIDGAPVDPRPFLALAACNRLAREPVEEARAPEGRRDK